MAFLIVFVVMAIGFYGAVNTAVQIADNEQHGAKALLAAESGLQFIRYHLCNVRIPAGTKPADVMAELHKDLRAQLENTPNMGANTVGLSGGVISIPEYPGGYLALDAAGHTRFRVTLTQSGDDVICKVSGYCGSTTSDSRTLSIQFTRYNYPTSVFDYAVTSRGGVSMMKGSVGGFGGVSADSIATVMSTKASSPAISISGGAIGGDISLTDPALAWISGGTVAGTSSVPDILANHTHVVKDVNFPAFDTTVFAQYATSTYSGGSTLKNVRIPPNTNPKFNGGALIEGILYIESPNTVEFRGNTLLRGFIVFENKGTSAVNKIDMRGNVSHLPIPPGAEFDSLRNITGIAVLAPTTSMVVSGSVDSSMVGSVILGSFQNGGSADWIIDQGTLLTADPGLAAVFNGKTVKFKSVGKDFKPTLGMKYDERFVPVVTTYKELY
jgi:hypothetical protein